MNWITVRKSFKIFVTKDFPKVYEQRVFFEGNLTDNDVATIDEGYQDNEPYSEHWVDAVVVKKPDWHWEIDEARKDFNIRRKSSIVVKKKQIGELEVEIEELKSMNFKRSNIKAGEYCKNLPTGQQEQIDRHNRIHNDLAKERLEREFKSQHKKMKELEAKIKELD